MTISISLDPIPLRPQDNIKTGRPPLLHKLSRTPGMPIHDTMLSALPVELLAEIFLLYCGRFCPVGSATQGPRLLLRVSKSWRDLAIDSPHLWSSFSLDVRPGSRRCDEPIDELARWIRRSRRIPLDFKVHYPVMDSTATVLFGLLIGASARWRDVRIHAPNACLAPLCDLDGARLPLLRKFKLETAVAFTLAPASLRIRWDQISTLDLFVIPVPTLDQILCILREAKALRRCRTNALCVLEDTQPEDEDIRLPYLSHFELKLYGSRNGTDAQSDLLSVLNRLSVPALSCLGISWVVSQASYRGFDGPTADGFAQFLARYGRRLQRLSLAYLPLDTHQLLRCLRVVPNLTFLGISLSQADAAHDSINDEFLSALSADGGLLPALKSAWLESHGEGFDDAALLAFLASRWRYSPSASGCLESLDIVAPLRRAEYRPLHFSDSRRGRLQVSARLKAERYMLPVLLSFMLYDFTDKMICFTNKDFPPDIRSLLVLV